jgi:cytochrome c5
MEGFAMQDVHMMQIVHAAMPSVLGRALRRLVIPAILALAMILASAAASAQGAERNGKDVVAASCVACHGSGANGAPKIGDNKAWAKRAAQGLASLTANALKGIRQMPPHGGNPNLTDTEIERAITYMVNQSGGHWIEPVSRTTKAPERTGEQIVKARCSKCHQTGEGGAPKIGDREAWIPRVKQGLDVVVRSAINGHGGMPARGGQADLTDSEIRSAVVYMFNKGTAK